MKLSILILTHNRPLLFRRCIDSVIKQIPDYDVEIIVNNDSNDIVEIYNDKFDIKYFYEKSNKLSNIYKFLLDKSIGEFVFFLEDDDYLLEDFFKFLDFDFDINFINYISKDIINYKKITNYYKRFFVKNKHLKKINELSTFLSNYDSEDFQFSQIVFKRNGLKYWPMEDNITNDYEIFRTLDLKSINYIQKPLWIQTTDGNDNISFNNLNKDERFN